MNAYEQATLDRIAILLGYRKWIKALLANDPSRAPYWKPLDLEYRAELAVLLRLARRARRLEAARPDPMSQWKSYADWSESEKAYGR